MVGLLLQEQQYTRAAQCHMSEPICHTAANAVMYDGLSDFLTADAMVATTNQPCWLAKLMKRFLSFLHHLPCGSLMSASYALTCGVHV